MPTIATGRRKSAVARAKLIPGAGEAIVNNRPLATYFPSQNLRAKIEQPLALLEVADKYTIWATIKGGGLTGQTEALRLAITRLLAVAYPEQRPYLKKMGLLVRDSRSVERKKYGKRKARKSPPFRKR